MEILDDFEIMPPKKGLRKEIDPEEVVSENFLELIHGLGFISQKEMTLLRYLKEKKSLDLTKEDILVALRKLVKRELVRYKGDPTQTKDKVIQLTMNEFLKLLGL